MRAAGIEEIETYISRWQNTVVKYIVTRPILDLYLDTKRRPGSQEQKWWWEQEGLVLPGSQASGEEGGSGDGYGYNSGDEDGYGERFREGKRDGDGDK